MKQLRILFNLIASLTSVMIASSLWVTKTDKWHIYLPICLICIILAKKF